MVVVEEVAQAHSNNDLTDDHADAEEDQQEAASKLVHSDDGEYGGAHIDCRR